MPLRILGEFSDLAPNFYNFYQTGRIPPKLKRGATAPRPDLVIAPQGLNHLRQSDLTDTATRHLDPDDLRGGLNKGGQRIL